MIYKITPSVESLYKPIKPLESTQSYEANGSMGTRIIYSPLSPPSLGMLNFYKKQPLYS